MSSKGILNSEEVEFLLDAGLPANAEESAKDAAAQAFYEHYRFIKLSSAGRRLFLPVTEIAMLFA